MANPASPFDPLPRVDEAELLEMQINQASRTGGLLVVDPDRGVQGVHPANGFAPPDGLFGIRRFQRHFLG